MKSFVRTALVTMAIWAGASGAADQAYTLAERSPKIDLSQYRSLELLQALEKNNSVWELVIIEHPSRRWVREEDLPALLEQLNSRAPATPVVLSASSFWPPTSTVASEAAFMIEGYRTGMYPPGLSARQLTHEKRDEITAWWNQRKCAGNLLEKKKGE